MRPAGLTEIVVSWQSRGLSNEKIRPPTTSNNSLSPKLKQHNSRKGVESKGSYLKSEKIIFTPSNIVNLLLFIN